MKNQATKRRPLSRKPAVACDACYRPLEPDELAAIRDQGLGYYCRRCVGEGAASWHLQMADRMRAER